MRSHLYWTIFLALSLLPACSSEKVAEVAPGSERSAPAPSKAVTSPKTVKTSQPLSQESSKVKRANKRVAAKPIHVAKTRSPQMASKTVKPRSTSAASSGKVGTRIRPPAKAPLPPFDGRRIALVHTSNMIGEIEPCG